LGLGEKNRSEEMQTSRENSIAVYEERGERKLLASVMTKCNGANI